MSLTYKDAGVDIDAGNRLVQRIKTHAGRTRVSGVLDGLGAFAGLFQPPSMRDGVLVSGTDGVGTKLTLAKALNRHDTIGVDLVAMCINDVLTTGALPLFFLDYFATGVLNVDVAEAVVKGIADGCVQSGCALLGGETAELPGMYAEGTYDLAGFAVGIVERDAIWGADRVQPEDVLVGVDASGLHSNGFSLARRALFDVGGLSPDDPYSQNVSLGERLLEPTYIYASLCNAIRELGVDVHAACHVTGGGLPENLPRILPPSLGARVDVGAWSVPDIFRLVQNTGGIDDAEMWRTFNQGIGFVFVVSEDVSERIIDAATRLGYGARCIGRCDASNPGRVEFLKASE